MQIYGERRKVLVDGLRKLGLEVTLPRATFYVWVKTDTTSLAFTEKMLEAGVVCTPGTGFGPSAEGYVRFAITQNVDRIREALSRMEKLLK